MRVSEQNIARFGLDDTAFVPVVEDDVISCCQSLAKVSADRIGCGHPWSMRVDEVDALRGLSGA